MNDRRWNLCDELVAKLSRIAVKAPNNYPDFLREIGASMDNDFARIEEILAELPSVLKRDLAELERVAVMLREAKRLYYSGDDRAGSKILWQIYNDEPITKWK